ncbi:MAG: hypothetical protein JNM06_18040 [Blastocatellia bacterium]|nr:hypothetical protein [Blastocatellia bacterium]MBN8724748.1 hypothetical protein [Acidobacteriota bacterium]
MQYQLLILSIKDKRTEYFVKKHLVEKLVFNQTDAQTILNNLPSVIFQSEDKKKIDVIANELIALGVEIQINSPSTKFCSQHIEQVISSSCVKCGDATCNRCQQENKNLCTKCFLKQQNKRRWTRYRQIAAFGILLVVLLVSARIYYTDHRKLDWDRTYNVALVEVVYDSKKDKTRALSISGRDLLQHSLEKWFESEAKRVYNSNIKPFRFKLLGPVFSQELAPELPLTDDNIWTKYKQTSTFINYFNNQLLETGSNPDDYDIKLYLYIYPADKREDYEKQHSVGTTRGRFGVVFLPVGKQSTGRTLCLIAHEILHTVGASDKYDENHFTLFPDGYFEPTKRYPQEFAEIMSLAFPLSPGKEKDAENLDLSRVGEKTAIEIGWKQP